jgi:hypothetical protein
MSNAQKCSVVIPAGRPDRDLAPLLDALRAMTCPEGMDLELLLVVPDTSGSKFEPDEVVRLVDAGGLHPPGEMRNIGAAQSRAGWLLFIDDDCLPPPDTLVNLLACAEQDDWIGAVGCRLVSAQAGFWNRCADYALFSAYQFDEEREIALGSAVLLVRRTAFEEAGGFDTDLRASEDWDFCLRLAGEGWACRFTPAVEVRHEHRRGSCGAILRMAWLSGRCSGLTVQQRHAKHMTLPARIALRFKHPVLYPLVMLPYALMLAVADVWTFRRDPIIWACWPVVFMARLSYQFGAWRALWRTSDR